MEASPWEDNKIDHMLLLFIPFLKERGILKKQLNLCGEQELKRSDSWAR